MHKDEDNTGPAGPDNAASEVDQHMAARDKRIAELQDTGLSRAVACGMADLEDRIARFWWEKWGDDLHVLIYGDFEAPDHDLDYLALGITVEAGKRTDTFIQTALCVVNARVKVGEKSLSAVLDAAARLNAFLGLWTMIDWGNRAIGWYCDLTHGISSGTVWGPFETKGIEVALMGIEQLPPKVKRKVGAALYWIREPKQMMQEGYRSDILRVYAGYWNAFECLVDAVCLIRPQRKMTRREKEDGITRFIAKRQGKLDVKSLTECYREFGDPSFVAKASYALKVCFRDQANRCIDECFRAKPEQEQLYVVRNAINHGNIDTDSLQEMRRVEDKCWQLKRIVFPMLGGLTGFSYPLNSGPR